jgi:PAS domain S-box-containing protein
LRYAAALAATAVALGLSLALQPAISRTPAVFFFAALAVSTWYGGLGPGLVTATLSVVAVDYFFIPPLYQLEPSDPSDLLGLSILGLVVALISTLQVRLRSARQQAEDARRAERALRERWQTTLASIGDGVIATDVKGRVTFMNPVAATLTSWTDEAAQGRTLDEVFVIISEQTRAPVENPVARVLREGLVVGLANHTVLLARDGTERAIDDSAAPIMDEQGQITGAVLVFRDVTAARQAEQAQA